MSFSWSRLRNTRPSIRLQNQRSYSNPLANRRDHDQQKGFLAGSKKIKGYQKCRG